MNTNYAYVRYMRYLLDRDSKAPHEGKSSRFLSVLSTILGDIVKTRLILKAGQPGTKMLVKKYGDALLCVRFFYDAKAE